MNGQARGYFLNNSTLYSKETWKQLSDPTARIMCSFNSFNWVLNLLYEAWHPPHTLLSWKWISAGPFSHLLILSVSLNP